MEQIRGRRISLPDRSKLITDIESSGCRLAQACNIAGIGTRTLERWKKNPAGDQRCGPRSTPKNKISSKEKQKIIETVNSPELRDKSPSQIVPFLADKGIYLASESSMYRILKDAEQSSHRSHARAPRHQKPMELVARAPREIFSWDITYLKSNVLGMFFYLYLVMDIYSRKIVGFEVHDKQSSELASELIFKICDEENIQPHQLILHSDNGKPMKGATLLATLQCLGVVPSFSRPSVSDDNPFSEALFRTTKYCPQFPTNPFCSIEEAREWVKNFVRWYNEEHLHSGINFVTPSSRHRGEDQSILIARHKLYEKAKLIHPERWSGKTRNWEKEKEVHLNCLKKKEVSGNSRAA